MSTYLPMHSHSRRRKGALARVLLRRVAGMAALLMLAGAMGASAAGAAPTASQPSTSAAPSRGAAPTWLRDFNEAARVARLQASPILVLARMKGCPYCWMFDETLKAESISAALGDYVLVTVDIDEDQGTVQALDLAVAPTVVVVTSDGIIIARHEGAASIEVFAEWLRATREKLGVFQTRAFTGEIDEMVALLADRNPVLRETMIQRLAARPDDAASKVVEAFARGNLSVRLASLDLLRLWRAPVDRIDPWKPQTVSDGIERLREWARDAEFPADADPTAPEELERDLMVWMTADDGPRTRAAYERLARCKADLVVKVRELTPETWDRRRERLTALRYRLVLPDEKAWEFPGIPFQMAAQNPQTRIDAVSRLGEHASADLHGFFLEAFTDPDEKVRETALRCLRKTGKKFAAEHVQRLLADPSANVRASILRELARAPLREMVDDVVEYALGEQDEDLAVHATRVLRALRNRTAAFEAILKMTEHESWRVRAEAIESLGSVSTSGVRVADLSTKRRVKAIIALKKALADEDLFVVSKAMDVLGDMYDADLSMCLGELQEIIERHPDLALSALGLMASHRSLRSKSLATIKGLCKHEDPKLRATAIRALIEGRGRLMPDELEAGLGDAEASVRIASADCIRDFVTGRQRRSSGTKFEVPRKTLDRLVPPLEEGASAEEDKERLSALLALAALGKTEFALPGIEEMVGANADRATEVVSIIPGVPWKKRKELFVLLNRHPLSDKLWGELVSAVFGKAPKTAADFLWETFESDPHVVACADAFAGAVAQFYSFRNGLHHSYGSGPKSSAKLAQRAAAQLTSSDGEKRVIALVLLCRGSPTKGEEEVRRLVGKRGTAPSGDVLTRAAVQIALARGGIERDALVIEVLGGSDQDLRVAGLESLLRDAAGLSFPIRIQFGERSLWADFLSEKRAPAGSSNHRPGPKNPWKPPVLPKGLKQEMVRPFLTSEDPERATGAAYLLALMGDVDGLNRLVDGWRDDREDMRLAQLVPRAVAALDRDEDAPILREVWESITGEEKNEQARVLYWTIRKMQSPAAKKLRDEMRKDVGWRLFR